MFDGNLSMVIQDKWGNYFRIVEGGKIETIYIDPTCIKRWRKQKIKRLYK
jgi:hypothetical protein